jgi:hypothetical protein
MLTPSTLLFEGHRTHLGRIAPDGAHLHRLLNQRPIRNARLARYLEGWAETNSAKIFAATAPGYRFCDPLVGTFTRWTVHEYFDLLQARLSGAGVVQRPDVAFILHGPMEEWSPNGQLRFWREAPRFGLTGLSEIELGGLGVMNESVAYDLNLASDALRRAFERSFE